MVRNHDREIENLKNQIITQSSVTTIDELNKAPLLETEQQTKLSQKEMERQKEIYLKPQISFACKAKFNEDYRKEYEFQKEYVNFVAENNEVIGESIEMWTHRFAGTPWEFWKVPVNKPVWGPRYLAEQITCAKYHTFKTEEKVISVEGDVSYTGQMISENTVHRLDARPVMQRKSVFMGINDFKGM